ncbi:hypothetical protein LEMLEM_LOCUS5078, partial [Lemmus lemmus]
ATLTDVKQAIGVRKSPTWILQFISDNLVTSIWNGLEDDLRQIRKPGKRRKARGDKSTEWTEANFSRQKRSRGFGKGIFLRRNSQPVPRRHRCQETLGPWPSRIRYHPKNQLWKRELSSL